MKNDKVKVHELRVRNVKCVKEVAIGLDGELHEIRGDAGQGKTTLLESIEGALRGLDASYVRKGETSAEIELRLSNATIHRIIAAEGKDQLMISTEDGSPVEEAKQFLATICNPATFRPISWVQLGGGEARGRTERLRRQRDMLLEAIPLSLSAQDVAKAVRGLGEDHRDALKQVNLDDVDFDQHAFVVCSGLEKACYEYRKLQNSRAEDAESALKHVPPPERPAPKATAKDLREALDSVTEAYHTAKARTGNRQALRERAEKLRSAIDEAQEDLPDADQLERTRAKYETAHDDARIDVERLEKELAEAKARLRDAETKLDKCDVLTRKLEAQSARKADLAALEEELSGDEDAPDLEAMAEAMAEAQADLEARQAQDKHDEAAQQAAQARARAILFSELVELFRDELPKRLIAEADLPVEGLAVDGDQVTVDGVPLHQLGTSQQITVGVLIASALNPNSGFVLVDGAESLGVADRKALATIAKKLDLQLIMTYVDPDASPGDGVTVMQAGAAVEVAAAAEVA